VRSAGPPSNARKQNGHRTPNDLYTLTIINSSKDKEFALLLYSKLREHGVECWFRDEHALAGRKLHQQTEDAIRHFEKQLLVVSPESISSERIRTEIRTTLKIERQQNQQKLLPIRIMDFEKIAEWQWFDPDTKKDLAAEVREYWLPDFTDWRDPDAFEAAFERLLRALEKPKNHASRSG
jgi:TIR domain